MGVQRKDGRYKKIKIKKIYFLKKTIFTKKHPKDRINEVTQERHKKLQIYINNQCERSFLPECLYIMIQKHIAANIENQFEGLFSISFE